MAYQFLQQYCNHVSDQLVRIWRHPICPEKEFCYHQGHKTYTVDREKWPGSEVWTFRDFRFEYNLYVQPPARQLQEQSFSLLFIICNKLREEKDQAEVLWLEFCRYNERYDLRDEFGKKFYYYNQKSKRASMHKMVRLHQITLKNGKTKGCYQIKTVFKHRIQDTLRSARDKMQHTYNLISGLQKDMIHTKYALCFYCLCCLTSYMFY